MTATLDDLDQPLPERARRRRLTPAMLGLAAILVAGLGFTAGVLVQKAQGGTTGAATPARAGGFPGAAGRAGGADTGTQDAGQPAAGTVSSTKGSTLYVKGSDGTTIKVRVGDGTTVTRTASSSARGVHPGDTVVVQGATAKNGTVKATSVTATAAGVQAAGGFGGFGGFSGGMPPTNNGGTP